EVNRPLAVALALLIGFFGGMVGIAGIAFVIAALVYLLRVPPRIAIGTSLGVGLFAAVAGIVGKAATAQSDPPLAAIGFVAALVARARSSRSPRASSPRRTSFSGRRSSPAGCSRSCSPRRF